MGALNFQSVHHLLLHVCSGVQARSTNLITSDVTSNKYIIHNNSRRNASKGHQHSCHSPVYSATEGTVENSLPLWPYWLRRTWSTDTLKTPTTDDNRPPPETLSLAYREWTALDPKTLDSTAKTHVVGPKASSKVSVTLCTQVGAGCDPRSARTLYKHGQISPEVVMWLLAAQHSTASSAFATPLRSVSLRRQ